MAGRQQTDPPLKEPEQISLSQAEEYLEKPYLAWLSTPDEFSSTTNFLAECLLEVPRLATSSSSTCFKTSSHHFPRLPQDKQDEPFRKVPVVHQLLRAL